MLLRDIEIRLKDKIPRSGSWPPGTSESYGIFGRSTKSIKRAIYAVTYNEGTEHILHQYDLALFHHPFHPGKDLKIPYGLFHTALDCCRGGLNDQWRDMLGIIDPKHFDANLGWYGAIAPVSKEDLIAKVEAFICGKIMGQALFTKDEIKSVCVCTGLGGLVLKQAAMTNTDCYIMGEGIGYSDESIPCIIETGHTLSERCGINLLRKILPEIQIDPMPIEHDRFANEVAMSAEFRYQIQEEQSRCQECQPR